jgi:hypothetical protein
MYPFCFYVFYRRLFVSLRFSKIISNIFKFILKATKLYVMKKPAYLTFDFKVKSIKSSEFSNLIATTMGLGSSV